MNIEIRIFEGFNKDDLDGRLRSNEKGRCRQQMYQLPPLLCGSRHQQFIESCLWKADCVWLHQEDQGTVCWHTLFSATHQTHPEKVQGNERCQKILFTVRSGVM